MDIKINQQSVICFDLDDTLYNEIEFLKSAYQSIAVQIAPEYWESLYAQMFAMYRKSENVFEYLNIKYKLSISALLEQYRNHEPNITPFNGVHTVLKNIKKANGTLCVITDGRSLTQRNKLKALGLLDYFDYILISSEINSEKPALLNYKLIEENFPNCKYTYIADNYKKDFIIPNKRNWDSIGLIDNGLNIHNHCLDYQLPTHLPKKLISKMNTLHIIV